MTEAYYFGCWGDKGHYLFGKNRLSCSLDTQKIPWGREIDSGLCPKGGQTEGEALLHHKDGWTALSFWDRSVDQRGNSNSNFIAHGTFDFNEMLDIAKQSYPEIFKRFTFEIAPPESE